MSRFKDDNRTKRSSICHGRFTAVGIATTEISVAGLSAVETVAAEIAKGIAKGLWTHETHTPPYSRDLPFFGVTCPGSRGGIQLSMRVLVWQFCETMRNTPHFLCMTHTPCNRTGLPTIEDFRRRGMLRPVLPREACVRIIVLGCWALDGLGRFEMVCCGWLVNENDLAIQSLIHWSGRLIHCSGQSSSRNAWFGELNPGRYHPPLRHVEIPTVKW